MANITINVTDGTGTGSAFVPEVWAQESFGVYFAYLQAARLVRTEFAGVGGTVGDVINIPRRGSLSVNTKAQDADVTLQAPTATNLALRIDKHKEVSFIVEDVNEFMANQNFRAGYINDAAKKLAEQVDTDVLGLATGFSQDVGDFTSQISEANFLKARKLIRKAKAPQNDPLSFICSPKCEEELAKIARFGEADKLGGEQRIITGQLGKWHGVDIYMNQLVKIDATDNTHNLMFHRDAIALAARQMPVPSIPSVQGASIKDPETGLSIRLMVSYLHKSMGWLVTLDCLYGVTETGFGGDDKTGVRVKTQDA